MERSKYYLSIYTFDDRTQNVDVSFVLLCQAWRGLTKSTIRVARISYTTDPDSVTLRGVRNGDSTGEFLQQVKIR